MRGYRRCTETRSYKAPGLLDGNIKSPKRKDDRRHNELRGVTLVAVQRPSIRLPELTESLPAEIGWASDSLPTYLRSCTPPASCSLSWRCGGQRWDCTI